MIGTNDLCAEMGIPSEFGHPRVVAAYEAVIAAARKHSRWIGMGGVPTEQGMAPYIGMGVRFILSANDTGLLLGAAINRAKGLRSLQPT